jgi:tRNA pseudouridine65 synthase
MEEPIVQSRVLPVLYRDEHLVAVHKPSGLLVHRTSLDAHERRFAVQLLRRQLRRRVYPVHRLDKGASGALLFGLDPQVAAALGEAVRRHALRRTYLAIVRGHAAEAGEIDHPLVRHNDPAERGREALEGLAQDAVTRFRRLATVELPHRVDRYPTSRYSLLELQPRTGRRHQLRRHLAHACVVGDLTDGRAGTTGCDAVRLRALLLACVELRFDHPATGMPLTIRALAGLRRRGQALAEGALPAADDRQSCYLPRGGDDPEARGRHQFLPAVWSVGFAVNPAIAILPAGRRPQAEQPCDGDVLVDVASGSQDRDR